MHTLRYARQTRAFFSTKQYPLSSIQLLNSSSNPNSSNINPNDVASCFREWFMARKNPLLDRIFEILRTHDDSSVDSSLIRFNLPLTEALVLQVLNYEKREVLSCLKFFDWAGRQPGFHHTRATFNAIFRILAKAKLMSLMLDFLQNYMKQRYVHKVRFYNVLVIGYSVAGKSEIALELFGRMRFQGVDLDSFAYHVLMNSLVEEACYDLVEMMGKQIRARGFENEITHSIMMKSLCRQNELKRGEDYLRDIVESNNGLSGVTVGIFVDALCKDKQFEKAALLVDEFQESGLVSMEHSYGVWIRELVRAGKLDGALEFLKDKEKIKGYVPDVFRYNLLICRLLRENRLKEVYDFLMEMKEREITPDDVTMNAALCFLCKLGMMDVAMDLYDSGSEFGLSVNWMAYNYLINTLLGDVSVDEAYRVLINSIEQGYFPGQKTFSIIVDALCREGKLDKMKELVLVALDRNIMPNDLIYRKIISSLCRSRRVEEGYTILTYLNALNRVPAKSTYANLISGFSSSDRGDIAAKLLVEMQERGYGPGKKLVREVIFCLCRTDRPEQQFFELLEMQLARHKSPSAEIYRYFIDGAGHAKKPELAKQVYEMMVRNGLEPDLKSDILLLRSYIKSDRISESINLFREFSVKRRGRKFWHAMIVGLCKAKRPEFALQIFQEMKANSLTPSIECYEELVKLYCDQGQYGKAVYFINDMASTGRPFSSFVGNVLLLNALRTRKLYEAWSYMSPNWMMGQLIGIFSRCADLNVEEVEKLIQLCFRSDIYTCNILLRRLSMDGIDTGCNFFYRLHEKGFEPNRWTYDIIVHGLLRNGRNQEARIWMKEMFSKGFDLTDSTRRIIQSEWKS